IRGQEAILTVSLATRHKTKWAEAGHEVAWEQFTLAPYFRSESPVLNDTAALTVEALDDELLVSAKDVVLRFSQSTGERVSYALFGKGPLAEPVQPNFWRAVADNDLGNKLHERCQVWRYAPDNRQLQGLSWKHEGESCVITSRYILDTAP